MKTLKRQAEPLHGPDDPSLFRVEIIRFGNPCGPIPLVEPACDQDQDSDHSERRCDQLKMTEKILDSAWGASKNCPCNKLDENFADHSRQNRRQDNEPCKFFESGPILKVGAPPLTPEVGDDGKHRAGVEHD